jgi:hypothetical protein
MLLEVPHWDPSVRAGPALLLGNNRRRTPGEERQIYPRRKLESMHISWIPGFQISSKLTFPVIRDIPVIRG